MSDAAEKPSFELRRPGGEVNSSRVLNVPGVVLLIAGAMISVFVLTVLAPQTAVRIIEVAGGLSPRRLMAGPEASGGVFSWFSPLIAHMFFHAGIAHLAFNTLWLLAVGAPIARRMKAENALHSFSAFSSASLFVCFYFLCGIAGALFFVALHANDFTLLIGASGGVSGLLGGVVRFAFNRSTIFGPENASISALTSPTVIAWTLVIIALNFVMGVFGGAFTGGANIAWEAHIGGYLFGLLAYPTFERLARAF